MREMEEKLEAEKEMESRKEKRKAMKKMKRKERRKEIAEKERLEEEALLNDPEEQRKRLLLEQQEAERIQRDIVAFQESERAWFLKQQLQQEHSQQHQFHNNTDNNVVEEEEEEEVDEDGPPEIIWQGNEIIIKKKKVTVTPNPLLLHLHHHNHQEHELNDNNNNNNRPTSNPFPPESPSQTHANSTVPENVAQQLPNFGTELDKDHCPFHLKTGTCRFGDRCSRGHFYPDKSCTLLIKNMYNGPGLAWEQDEGLEILCEIHFGGGSSFGFACLNLNILAVYTDEEVEHCFEDFYEDVHTEFLKFGEIVNFKVCKNGSFHLRGNVYIQYKLLDSALLAYNSVHGRYFAGKQVSCKFVNLTRWKVAICGEYMKSGYKTCSHGTACNFIHCFRNPGGDYEWADSDKPPPKFWVKEMIALFGHSDDFEISSVPGSLSALNHFSNAPKTDSVRYHSRISRSKEMGLLNGGHSGRKKHDGERKQRTDEERNSNFKDNHKKKCRNRTPDTESDRKLLEEIDGEKYHEHTRKNTFNRNKDENSRRHKEYSDEDGDRRRHHSSLRKGSRHQSRGNRIVTDESESDKDRGHAEYSDVDWDTMTRDSEKQHGREGRNLQKWISDNRYQTYEAEPDGDRHRKRHHRSQMKESRHQSRDSSYVIVESDKDRGEMETQHDYSRKSSKHKRSGLQDYCEDYENDKVDGGQTQRKSDRRAHHPKNKILKHQKKFDSIDRVVYEEPKRGQT